MSDTIHSEASPTERVLIRRFEVASRWCGAAAAVLGVTMLLVWVTWPAALADIETSWLMRANCALCAAACGMVLLLRTDRLTGGRARVSAGLLAVAGLLAALTLVEYMAGVSFGIDTIFARSDETGLAFAGRMAPQTALAIVLLVTGLSTAHRKTGFGSYACDGAIIGLAMLLHIVMSGYFFHDASWTGINSVTRMSPQAVVVCALLWIGLVSARTHAGLARILSGDGRGSVVIRYLLPPTMLLPVVFASVRLWSETVGWETQVAPLFNTVQNLMRMTVIVGMGYLLNRSEAQRKAERARREEAERMVAMCAWTSRVRWNGEWVPVDDFLRERFGLEITHGISEEALADELATVNLAALELAKQREAA